MRESTLTSAIAAIAIASSLTGCTPSETPGAPADGTTTVAEHSTNVTPAPSGPTAESPAPSDTATSSETPADVLTQLEGLASPEWAHVSSEGAAGHTFITYRENTTGEELTLRVSNDLAMNRQEGAIDDVLFASGP